MARVEVETTKTDLRREDHMILVEVGAEPAAIIPTAGEGDRVCLAALEDIGDKVRGRESWKLERALSDGCVLALLFFL